MPDTDLHLPFYGYVIGFIKLGLLHATVGLPPQGWWLPALVVLVLGAAAAIDAFTSTVPDWLIFAGMLAVVAAQGFYVSWPFASRHLTIALMAAIGLWALNMLWHRLFRRDALGMGDAKWTMLAVACFDVTPVLFAWGCGACIAVAWMGALRLARYRITRVYFAPFLFIGLMIGIYWLRLRGASP